jgi:hypothetical protein
LSRQVKQREFRPALAPRTVVVGTLCVIIGALLVMSRQSSVVNWVADVDAAGQIQSIEQVDAFDPSDVALPATDAAPPVSSRSAAAPSPAPAPTAAMKQIQPIPAAKFEYVPTAAPSTEPEPKMVTASLRPTTIEDAPAASATSSAKETIEETTPATIAGCLQRDDERFVLKDTSGADAPKSRSWKSGFLRKRSSSVEVTGDTRLASYVGRRIETSGVLADGEMRVRSVRVLGLCD